MIEAEIEIDGKHPAMPLACALRRRRFVDPTATAVTVDRASAHAALAIGSASVLTGVLFSGPLSLVLQAATHPQPPWRDAATFALNYHPVQLLPYAFGLLLVGGFLVTIAALHCLAEAAQRTRTTVALLFAGAFGALILLNYVVQVAFVPLLCRPWSHENASILAALTMSNPRSLGWGLEMSGYGLLGISTWLCAPVLSDGSSLSRAAAWCFATNGPVSVASAIAAVVARDWLLQPSGLWAFGVWNALVVAMGVLTFSTVVSKAKNDLVFSSPPP